jgi:chromosome segregation ATPase
MARFSGKIQSAKFVNQDENVIEILYGDTSAQLSSWVLQVDYSNQDFLDLIEEISLEDIADATYQHHSSNKSAYDREIEAKASQLASDMAQDMFNKWMEQATNDIKQEYDKVDSYREEHIRTMQAELDQQLLERQAELDQQLLERYNRVDQYKEEQLRTIQAELDQQLLERYNQVDRYKEEQMIEVDKYKEIQKVELEEEAAQLKQQVEQVKLEIDYAETQKEQIKKQKADIAQEKMSLLEKFKSGLGLPQQSSMNITGEEFIKLLFSKNDDENFLFKAKIAVFNQDHVKNNPDREAKMAIKKSKTIIDLVVAMKT